MLQLIVVLVVCGLAWYFLQPYVAEPFKSIVVVIVVLLICLWLLSLVGVVPFHLQGLN